MNVELPILDQFDFHRVMMDYDWLVMDCISFKFPKSSYRLRFGFKHYAINQGEPMFSVEYMQNILVQRFWRYLGAA